MRVRGTEVAVVAILDVWRQPQPVFHREENWGHGETVCGRDCGSTPTAICWLPARLAVKFARPCERCFPRGPGEGSG